MAGLTVGETYFFRDAASFDALRDDVLPELIERRRSQGSRRLRVWSAACATGEEAYSLAILLDRLLPDRGDWKVTILATDIHVGALDVARRGLYREWSFRQTPADIRARYFRAHGSDAFEIDPAIRSAVAFAPLNLAAEIYPDLVTNTTAVDLILCRNVLIYFTREAQQLVAARLGRALTSDGWLLVSAVEASASLFAPLLPVNVAGVTFYRRPSGREPGTKPTDQPTRDRSDALPPATATAVMPPVPPAAVAVAQAVSPLEEARALADEGQLDEALRLCRAALAHDRLDLDAHLLLAAVCQETGEIPAALDALRAAVYLAPESALAHFLLGALLLRCEQRRRGALSMQTAVRLLALVPPDEPILGAGGVSAGRLLEAARQHLEGAA
ncbi:MAG: protein-glutamate O-methyltransferase CheR [Vicinamibacteria bacterium]|nr:protein-glutamate O-methyltransferase CheR [Vicinamibacteria bacterium]